MGDSLAGADGSLEGTSHSLQGVICSLHDANEVPHSAIRSLQGAHREVSLATQNVTKPNGVRYTYYQLRWFAASPNQGWKTLLGLCRLCKRLQDDRLVERLPDGSIQPHDPKRMLEGWQSQYDLRRATGWAAESRSPRTQALPAGWVRTGGRVAQHWVCRSRPRRVPRA